MIEADHARTVRVRAPVATVWDELCTLDRLVKQIPEISSFEPTGDGRTAKVSLRLGWGPISWKFGRASVAETTAMQRMRWQAEVPSLRLDFTGHFELAPGATPQETTLTYRGVVRCRHGFVGRLQFAMASFIEGHVNSLSGRIADLAAQHDEAQRRLSHPPEPHP